MNNNLVKQGYNQAAENYLGDRDQFNNLKYLTKLVSLLPPRTKVLDIGCGAGKPIDEYLVGKGLSVTGIDISDKQILLAQKNVPQANYQVRDMAEIKEGEYQVDVVVSFYAIFHIDRRLHQELFNKINSFLPVGGYVLVTMGASAWEGQEDDFHGAKMYWSHYGRQKNRQIVENAGFEIVIDEVDTGGGERHQVLLSKKISSAPDV